MKGIYLVSKYDPDNTPIPDDFAAKSLPRGFAAALAALRTDLDRFSPVESELLRYHGYWSAHARMASIAPAFALSGMPAWRDYSDIADAETQRLLAVLAAGRKHRPRLRRTT